MSQSGALSAAGGGGTDLLTLEGDTGGIIQPDGTGNIFILGGPGVSVDGDPGTNTLTINATGTSVVTVQTVDATPTLLEAVTLSMNQAIEIEVSLIAPQDTFASAIGGRATAVARRAGGGAVICGAPQGSLMYDSGGNPSISFAASGNDVNILVTGVAATTYNWRAIIRITYNA